MRGRPIGPTEREKEVVEATGPSFYKERLGTESPPHQSPPVTASPQGEAFVGGVSPQRKAFSPNHCSRKMRIQIRARRWAPKQPLYRNNASPNPKTSECQRAGHKTGGPGGLPPALFLPISREKWGPPPGRRGPRGAAPRGTGKAPTTRRVRSTLPSPRPGPGGNPRGRSGPAPVQKGPPADDRGPVQDLAHAPEAQPVPSTGPW